MPPGPRFCSLLPETSRTLRAGGFTLIEILVVIVIVGIMVSIATVAVGVLGRDREIEDQARKLWAITAQAREEAELQSQELGLFFSDNAYLFLRFDPRGQVWTEVSQDDLLSRRELPAGLRFRLWMESREVLLKPMKDTEPKEEEESSEKDEESEQEKKRREEERRKNQRRPQVALLSNGDVTPFELRIEREGSEVQWRVMSQPDNSLAVEEVREQQ